MSDSALAEVAFSLLSIAGVWVESASLTKVEKTRTYLIAGTLDHVAPKSGALWTGLGNATRRGSGS